MVINIVTRELWQAMEPKIETTSRPKVTHVFWMNVKQAACYTKVHCMETLKKAQLYNMVTQNQRDIRFNFMIGGDGNVYEGRGWGVAPLLPKEFGRKNNDSVLIGFMGVYETAKEIPELMFQTGQDLVAYGVNNEFVDEDFKVVDLVNDVHVTRPPGGGDPNYRRERVDYEPRGASMEGEGGYYYGEGGYRPSSYGEGGHRPSSYGREERPNRYSEDQQPDSYGGRQPGYRGARWFDL